MISIDIEPNPPTSEFKIYDTSFEIHELNDGGGVPTILQTYLIMVCWLLDILAYGMILITMDMLILSVKTKYSPNYIKLYTNDGSGYYTSSILNIDNDNGIVIVDCFEKQ